MKTVLIAIALLTLPIFTPTASAQDQDVAVFTKLLNSESEAKKLAAGLTELARRSPYNLPTTTVIAQRLAVADMKATDILAALDSCGEIAAALDLSDDGYLELTTRMAQMRKDRNEYTYLHLLALEQIHVPAFSLLGEAIGKTERQTEFLARRRQLKAFGTYQALLYMFKTRYEGTAAQVKKRRSTETP